MQVVYSPEHLRHDPTHEAMLGRPVGIYDVVARAETIRSALEADERFGWAEPTAHGIEPITAVHDPGMVAHLAEAWQHAVPHAGGVTEIIPDTYLHAALREGMGPAPRPESGVAALGTWVFDTATPLVEGTYAAARASVDVALTALDLVLGGERQAYGLCRPPGHHAARAVYGGYCYFNNAGVTAQAALDAGAGRVTVLDVDYHHGNGTQQLFYARGDVQYVSLHADPNRAYPYFTGYADETGAHRGRGATLNVPLAEGVDDEAYLVALRHALDAVDRFEPAVVVVSLGVDTYHLDPIGDLGVTTEGFGAQGRAIAQLDRPVVVLQEGGYHVGDLGRNVHAFLGGLAG